MVERRRLGLFSRRAFCRLELCIIIRDEQKTALFTAGNPCMMYRQRSASFWARSIACSNAAAVLAIMGQCPELRVYSSSSSYHC